METQSTQKQVGHDSIVPGTLETCPTVSLRRLLIRRSLVNRGTILY